MIVIAKIRPIMDGHVFPNQVEREYGYDIETDHIDEIRRREEFLAECENRRKGQVREEPRNGEY